MMRSSIARPPPPPSSPPRPIDEGPSRRELRRQIARFERILAELSVLRGEPCSPINLSRGPALLATRELESIRDELLAAAEALAQATRRA